jgi:hypothetical protein
LISHKLPLQRSLAEKSLSQNRERTALRLLALSGADIDEVLDIGGDAGRVGAVEVSHVKDVGRAALGVGVGAAADDGLTGGERVGGGGWGGEGEAREGGDAEDGEELHFGLWLGDLVWVLR